MILTSEVFELLLGKLQVGAGLVDLEGPLPFGHRFERGPRVLQLGLGHLQLDLGLPAGLHGAVALPLDLGRVQADQQVALQDPGPLGSQEDGLGLAPDQR